MSHSWSVGSQRLVQLHLLGFPCTAHKPQQLDLSWLHSLLILSLVIVLQSWDLQYDETSIANTLTNGLLASPQGFRSYRMVAHHSLSMTPSILDFPLKLTLHFYQWFLSEHTRCQVSADLPSPIMDFKSYMWDSYIPMFSCQPAWDAIVAPHPHPQHPPGAQLLWAGPEEILPEDFTSKLLIFLIIDEDSSPSNQYWLF